MRNNKIDTIKGVLIILVIGIHVSSYLLIQRNLTEDRLPDTGFITDYVLVFLRNVINFAVPGFLFVSGYILAKVYADTQQLNPIRFYKKRVTRIYVPFVIWLLVYLLFWGKPSFYRIFMGLIFLDGWFHFWFLWIIFVCYLLFPFLLRSIKRNPALSLAAIIAAGVCATLLLDVSFSNSYTINYIAKDKLLSLPKNIFYFCVGIASYTYVKKDIFGFAPGPSFKSLLLIVYILTICLKMNYGSVFNYPLGIMFNEMVFNLISILFLIEIIEHILSKPKTVADALCVLGLSSYGIYLSHVAVLYISRRFFGQFFSSQSPFHAVSTFLVCIVFAYLLSRLLANKKIGAILGY
jgi:peptidoglycan/LPS O-acetylase OafA/YrhL